MTQKKSAPTAATVESTTQIDVRTVHIEDSTDSAKVQEEIPALLENPMFQGFFTRIFRDMRTPILTYNEADAALALSGLADYAAKTDGFLMKAGETYWVFIDANLSPYYARLVFAHELGHAMMGHMDEPNFEGIDNRQTEAEANLYAAVLLALMTWKAYEPTVRDRL